VKAFLPKYSDIQLQSILDADVQLPYNINEQDFVTDIKNNSKIKWRVNHFLFRKKLLPYILDTGTFNKWRIFKSLNWIIVLFIVGFSIWTGNYRILFFLIIYSFLIITFDHWIFIFNMSVLITIKLIFKINIPYFWLFVTIILLGYLLNKVIDEMIEKKILNRALTDLRTFWIYYSNKIIWMDENALNNECQRLTEKYTELRN
jgi:hypothetical protein